MLHQLASIYRHARSIACMATTHNEHMIITKYSMVTKYLGLNII